MDFEEFCNNFVESPPEPKIEKKSQPKQKAEKTAQTQPKSQTKDMPKIDEQKLSEQLKKYQSYSQQDLLSALLAEASKQKAQGNLTQEKLSQIEEQIMPLLTDEQKKNLQQIIKMLR